MALSVNTVGTMSVHIVGTAWLATNMLSEQEGLRSGFGTPGGRGCCDMMYSGGMAMHWRSPGAMNSPLEVIKACWVSKQLVWSKKGGQERHWTLHQLVRAKWRC